MEPFAAAFETRLDELVAGFRGAVEGLPLEALDWSPGPQMNSITVLATHATAATRYLIGDVIAGEPSGRVREQEFRAASIDAATLLQRLEATAAYAKQVVNGLHVDELGKARFSPQHKREYSVAWCMLRALDHLAEHMGHAQLTRLLWEEHSRAK